jgi:transposase InsO family protein
MVTDRGAQFQNEYRAWCAAHRVRPRFGAVGQHGSIAVVERFIRSMKEECFRATGVPFALRLLELELDSWLAWYHAHRPHQGLKGRTPAEVLRQRADVTRQRPPPRPHKMRPVRLIVGHLDGRAHLPIVALRRAT